MVEELMLYEHGKDNSRKFALSLLQNLENAFPKWTLSSKVIIKCGYHPATLETLRKNGLIRMSKIPLIGIPKKEDAKFIEAYQITSDGISFLNSLKQKKTNSRLLVLTWVIVIMTVLLSIDPIFKLIKIFLAQT